MEQALLSAVAEERDRAGHPEPNRQQQQGVRTTGAGVGARAAVDDDNDDDDDDEIGSEISFRTNGQPSGQKSSEAGAGTGTSTSTGEKASAGDKPRKRKKAARACNHCQTAHLTCDDERPCLRCVKRNLGDTCQDGVRKKAKYLRDIDDEVVNAGKVHPTNFAPASQSGTTTTSGSQQAPPSSSTSDRHSPSVVGASKDNAPVKQDPSPVNPFSTLPPSLLTSSVSGGEQLPHHHKLDPNSLAPPSNTTNNNSSSRQSDPLAFFNDFNTSGDFGSHGANLEYAVLSSMLNNAGFGSTSPNNITSNLPMSDINIFPSISSGYGENNVATGHIGQIQDTSFGFPPTAFQSNTIHGGTSQSPQQAPDAHSGAAGGHPSVSPFATDASVLAGIDAKPASSDVNGGSSSNNNNNTTSGFRGQLIDHNWAPAKPTPSHPSQTPDPPQYHRGLPSLTTAGGSNKPVISNTGVMRVDDVYRYVNKPYNYLEGYHALIRYLQKSFKNKSDTLRIIRALSIYRPSLIALQMQLTPEDEVFVERSFQRTLIEMEKLISFSGTPTVVWRRTGEIMLVGTEFTLLSEWKREDLLWKSDAVAASGANTNGNGTPPNPAVVAINGKGGNSRQKPKRRYIFEIFDQPSTVEYYESFAAHAFESSSTTIMSTCAIVTPSGRKVPCTFGYNLKRDIFGLPNMVIGQFLPILSSASS